MPRLRTTMADLREEAIVLLEERGYEVLRTWVDSTGSAEAAGKTSHKSAARTNGVPDILVTCPGWCGNWLGIEFTAHGSMFPNVYPVYSITGLICAIVDFGLRVNAEKLARRMRDYLAS